MNSDLLNKLSEELASCWEEKTLNEDKLAALLLNLDSEVINFAAIPSSWKSEVICIVIGKMIQQPFQATVDNSGCDEVWK